MQVKGYTNVIKNEKLKDFCYKLEVIIGKLNDFLEKRSVSDSDDKIQLTLSKKIALLHELGFYILPDPDILANEIIENIESGLSSFKEIMDSINQEK